MARHLTLEGKITHKRRVITSIIVIASCFLLSIIGTLAIINYENTPNETRCSQGANTPVLAVTRLLTAVKNNDWTEACKYTDSDAETTRRIMASTTHDNSRPTVSSQQSSVDGWVAVTYKSTDDESLETQVWCRQTPDGRWVVSMTGD